MSTTQKSAHMADLPLPMPEAVRFAMEHHIMTTGLKNVTKHGAVNGLRGAFTSGVTAVLTLLAHKQTPALEELYVWWRAGLEATGATETLEALDHFLEELD